MNTGSNRRRLTAGLLALTLAGASACGEEDDEEPSLIDKITESDCSTICDDFDACVRDIDVEICIEQCDTLDETDANDALAERCEDCLDDRDCVEADAAGCWNDCIWVPEMSRSRPTG